MERAVFPGKQVGRTTFFRDCSVRQDHDLVSAADSAHPVGDDDHSLVPDQAGERFLDHGFVLHIQAGACLIQQDDRRVLQEGPGDGDTLAFATGKLASVFTNDRIISLRQFHREFVAVGQPGRRQHFIIRGVFFSDPDVFQNAVVEQRDILEHDGIDVEQGLRINAGNVLPADGDPPAADIPEPCGQAGNGGLSTAGRSDKRRDLVLLCRKGYILQD